MEGSDQLPTIIWPVVLYGCETWSLTLRDEHTLRVFENRVLTRIFGAKTDEVAGEWRRLYNEGLYDLHFSPNIIRVIKSRMRWAGNIACMGVRTGAHTILVGRPKGRRPLGKPTPKWQDNLKMDLQEAGWGGIDWIDRSRIGTAGGLF
jgi:hypothetical protein